MLREYLSTIANAIRSILGGTAKINAQDFADKVEEVFKAGYNSAVREGEITFTENSTKEFKVTGLPKAPKNFFIVSSDSNVPSIDDEVWIRSLEYKKEGIGVRGKTTILALMVGLVSSNVSSGNYSSYTITSNMNPENLIIFENGTFTIKTPDTKNFYFAKNFTYKWIATF